MKRFLKISILVLLVLIVGAIIAVGFFLGDIVKKGVETVGPQITKVDVKLDAVDLSLLTGSAKVKGLVVGNPEGYKAPQAISVGLAAVKVDPFTVLSDKIVIKSIRVEAPEITFEGNPLSGNNLTKIMENVNAAAKSSQKPATNETGQATKPPMKMQVDDFLITGSKVHLGANGPTLPLPDIHLTDLGKGTDGITAAELTKRVLSEVVHGTIKAVASAAGNISKSAETLSKDATEGASKITKSLGGLFKKSTN